MRAGGLRRAEGAKRALAGSGPCLHDGAGVRLGACAYACMQCVHLGACAYARTHTGRTFPFDTRRISVMTVERCVARRPSVDSCGVEGAPEAVPEGVAGLWGTGKG